MLKVYTKSGSTKEYLDANASLTPSGCLVITEAVPDLKAADGTTRENMLAMFHPSEWIRVEDE